MRLTRSLWRTRLWRPQRPGPSEDADPEVRHSQWHFLYSGHKGLQHLIVDFNPVSLHTPLVFGFPFSSSLHPVQHTCFSSHHQPAVHLPRFPIQCCPTLHTPALAPCVCFCLCAIFFFFPTLSAHQSAGQLLPAATLLHSSLLTQASLQHSSQPLWTPCSLTDIHQNLYCTCIQDTCEKISACLFWGIFDSVSVLLLVTATKQEEQVGCRTGLTDRWNKYLSHYNK